jgi:hypothetical protein
VLTRISALVPLVSSVIHNCWPREADRDAVREDLAAFRRDLLDRASAVVHADVAL